MCNQTILLIAVFSPLVGAVATGFFPQSFGRRGTHCTTIALLGVALVCSLVLAKRISWHQSDWFEFNLYTWASGGEFFPYRFHVGFMVDSLTVLMMVVVNYVSFLVHIYSIGYMADDAVYQRFFSYISLFTFAMLMLVTANNFLQLFFGWEGVGLVSYLLIGYYYQKPAAIHGNLKAFMVNRVGDFGFVIGIALVLGAAGSLDYHQVFNAIPQLVGKQVTWFSGHSAPLLTVIALCLFIGAMGKSAQVPLHVWLPESMEGPTPISALIHAATMVTAGVFLLARMSPIFDNAQSVLSFVMIIGATGAFFTGLIGIVVTDIKRVVAYSTLSQLGYMVTAMGISAYNAGIYHMMTHACFKALLFLGAGSVIMAMHHEQDMRKMGGLWRKMPITYVTMWIGSLALCAIPPFAGFFSKDTIIDATGHSHIWGSTYAYYCVLWGALVTSLYTFRMIFMTFHGTPRMDKHTWEHAKESPAVVGFPLIMLAIPSLLLGYYTLRPMLYSQPNLLTGAVKVSPAHDVLAHMPEYIQHPDTMMMHALHSTTFMLAISGIILTWIGYVLLPGLPARLYRWCWMIHKVLVEKFFFDAFYEGLLLPIVRKTGQCLYCIGDRCLIDGAVVNGSAKLLRGVAAIGRRVQTGYIYHYTLAMVVGLLIMLFWIVIG